MKALFWVILALALVPCAKAQIQPDQIGNMHICCGTVNTTWPSISTAPSTSSFSASPSAAASAILRFWNNGCRWTDIAPGSASDSTVGVGQNNPLNGHFGTCDTEIKNARTNHATIYYTVGNTPLWACSQYVPTTQANPFQCPGYYMPTDANYQNYVKAVRDRVPANATTTINSCTNNGSPTLITCTAATTINQTTGLIVGGRILLWGTNNSQFNADRDANGYDVGLWTVQSINGSTVVISTSSSFSGTVTSTGGTAGRPYGCSSTDSAFTGCIRYWSGYNEPNNNGTTSSLTVGNVANLVHLYAIMRLPVIRVTDTKAKLYGPEAAGWNNVSYSATATCNQGVLGFGNQSEASGYICLFLTTNGSGSGEGRGDLYIDGISHHFYTGANTLSSIAEGYITEHQDRDWLAAQYAGDTICGRGTYVPANGSNTCLDLATTEYDWGTSGSQPRINSANDNTPGNNANGVCPNSDDYLASGCWMNDQAAFLIKYTVIGLDGVTGYTDAGGTPANSNAVTSRFIWYKWADNDFWGGLYCQQSGTGSLDAWNDCATSTAFQTGPFQKPAASAFGTLITWLSGLTPTGPCTISSNVWSCKFTGNAGYKAVVVWDSNITNSASPASFSTSGYTQMRDMFGHVVNPVPPLANVGYSPQLFEAVSIPGGCQGHGVCVQGTGTIQ